MSRLTRFVIDEYFAKNFNYESLIEMPDEDYKAFNEIVDKLGYYETLEKQGRLIELPCDIGDVVYHIVSGEVFTGIVHRFSYFPYAGTCILVAYDMDNCLLGGFGESCFTTRQEAEVKLKELQNE